MVGSGLDSLESEIFGTDVYSFSDFGVSEGMELL